MWHQKTFSSIFTGIHASSCVPEFFLDLVVPVAEILKDELSRHPEKQVIFRSTLPQHFFTPGQDHGFFTTDAVSCGPTPKPRSHFTNFYMEQITKFYGFKFLDSTGIYKDRWDMHFPLAESLDCSHWCYSPEIIVPEVALLNQLLT